MNVTFPCYKSTSKSGYFADLISGPNSQNKNLESRFFAGISIRKGILYEAISQ